MLLQVVLDCIPCYIRQVINTLRKAQIEEEISQNVINGILPMIEGLNPMKTPAENSSIVLHRAYELMGKRDPFSEAKRESNTAALKMLPKLTAMIEESKDPLYKACKVAVAGNIVDMGILENFDIGESVAEAIETKFSINDYDAFVKKLENAHKVLILGDNSGEIAFDKLLAGQLEARGLDVVYAVKGGPILNDATLEDAAQVQMGETAAVITNGNKFLGTLTDYCSEDFLKIFAEADVIISKGQANYESLESTAEAGEKTFFVLKAKCPVVAKNLKVNLGDIVFSRNKPSQKTFQ